MSNVLNVLNFKTLIVHKDKLLCYKGGKIWIDYNGFKKMCFRSKNIFCKIRLLERLFRLEPRLGFEFRGSMFFSMKGFLYRVDENRGIIKKILSFRKGMNNPLSICKAFIGDTEEIVYFGDYWPNKQKNKCNIYKFDGDNAIIVNCIEGVKHIHSIVFDSYKKCFYILTGDSNSESNIFIANIDFSSINPIFSSDKKYRSCALIPTSEGLIYATDNPSSENWIKYIPIEKSKYLEPVNVVTIPGPCIFGGYYNKLVIFSTSVEPNPEQNILKYWLSSKHGAGNKDHFSYALIYEDGKIEHILKLIKDDFNMAFFGFGNNQIMGFRDEQLFVYCSAVKKYDGKTLIIDLKKEISNEPID